MINKLEISGVHTEIDSDLKKYVTTKIGRLDKYLPKKSRESAHAEVFLKEAKAKQRTCEVILYLPNDQLTAKETTINMYAAIDIVEAKLKTQIKKYSDTHGTRGLRRKVLARFKHKV